MKKGLEGMETILNNILDDGIEKIALLRSTTNLTNNKTENQFNNKNNYNFNNNDINVKNMTFRKYELERINDNISYNIINKNDENKIDKNHENHENLRLLKTSINNNKTNNKKYQFINEMKVDINIFNDIDDKLKCLLNKIEDDKKSFDFENVKNFSKENLKDLCSNSKTFFGKIRKGIGINTDINPDVITDIDIKNNISKNDLKDFYDLNCLSNNDIDYNEDYLFSESCLKIENKIENKYENENKGDENLKELINKSINSKFIKNEINFVDEKNNNHEKCLNNNDSKPSEYSINVVDQFSEKNDNDDNNKNDNYFDNKLYKEMNIYGDKIERINYEDSFSILANNKYNHNHIDLENIKVNKDSFLKDQAKSEMKEKTSSYDNIKISKHENVLSIDNMHTSEENYSHRNYLREELNKEILKYQELFKIYNYNKEMFLETQNDLKIIDKKIYDLKKSCRESENSRYKNSSTLSMLKDLYDNEFKFEKNLKLSKNKMNSDLKMKNIKENADNNKGKKNYNNKIMSSKSWIKRTNNNKKMI